MQAVGCALCVLAGLERGIVDLGRMSAWLVAHDLVNAAPDFGGTAPASSMASLTPYWTSTAPRRGCTPADPGVATLPLNHAVFVAAEVEITTA